MSLLLLFHPGVSGGPGPDPDPEAPPPPPPLEGGGAVNRNPWREIHDLRRARAAMDEEDLYAIGYAAAEQLARDHIARNRRH